MISYLPLERAKIKLIAGGLYTEAELPDDAILTETLSSIETQINLWMGYNLAPTEYKTERRSNRDGRIVLPYYPVIEILSAQKIGLRILGKKETETLIDAVWCDRIDKNTIQLDAPNQLYRVTYISGQDLSSPKLMGLGDAVFELLKKVAEAGGDVSVLNRQARFVSSTSLPNISQTFIVPGASAMSSRAGGGVKRGFTELDAILAPFSEFKRTVFY